MLHKVHSAPSASIPISPSMGPLLESEQITGNRHPVDRRVLYLCWLAFVLALIMGFVAKALVMCIGLITNLSFYGRFSFEFSSPADNQLGWYVTLIPVLGGLIVGLLARYGSVAIRGHGIPEAMEQVLENESRIPPKITFLKPLSAAIAIGTGGPFGAEGPIIATGGAMGSVLSQLLKTTPEERKILLTAGATAGMAAVFGSPVSAVMLAIELLLFEFSARSIIPVATACVTGAGIHVLLEGTAPMFSFPLLPAPGGYSLLLYTLIGTLVGVLGVGASKIVYWVEDMFEKLPIHWMWWPALGGLAVGIIGYVAPLTLGVGYSNIQHVLEGSWTAKTLLLLCVMKFVSWAIALGSGTSGGTLAPLLTIGAAAGALSGIALNVYFPGAGISVGMAAVIGMAAMFAGASRALLTSIIFAFETTLQPLVLLPLLGGCTAAYLISFLLMRNTIMTEKIVRRGISVPDTYGADAFERLSVTEATLGDYYAAHETDQLEELRAVLPPEEQENFPTLILVVDQAQKLKGCVRLKDILQLSHSGNVASVTHALKRVVYDNQSLKEGVRLLTESGEELIPVLSREEGNRLLGVLTHKSILDAFEEARQRNFAPARTIHLTKRGMRMMLFARSLRAGRKKNQGPGPGAHSR
jgi:CIC family chloride channel protein